jgi:hypothetical protein
MGAPPASPEEIATLEKRLGTRLPDSYRHFLLTNLDQLRELRLQTQEAGELRSYQALLGSVRMMQARLGWLDEVANTLGLAALASGTIHA